jgi:predicted RNA binding protein YcfA (HicA-like mRNA interferase family)
MPRFGPISRRDLVRNLRSLGFEEPEARGSHEIMRRGDDWVAVPNPHRGDISKELLSRVLRQAGISREEWGKL